MASLGVNIDHIANIREARRTVEPDPVSMALLAELGGADGITVHLREDRRHIQDRDVELLRQTVRSRLNLELAATEFGQQCHRHRVWLDGPPRFSDVGDVVDIDAEAGHDGAVVGRILCSFAWGI